MEVIFKGKFITPEKVLTVIQDFDARYPDTNAYDSWLENGNYKYALQHRGKLYPCKHILSLSAGIPVSEFSGGDQTNIVFERLGFEVVDKLQAIGPTPGEDEFTSAEEVMLEDGQAVTEGAIKQIYVNVYERNPAARRKCIQHYGYICFICEFNFKDRYGEVGKNLIHVHHLTPLSKIGTEYQLDPVKDLRPVCPNCHAVIHRRKEEPYSMEEMKEFIQNMQKEL